MTLESSTVSPLARAPRALAALALLALSASACSRASATKAALPARDAAQPTVAVRASKPLPRLDGETARATGDLRSKQQATLSAQASGTITKVFADVGTRVRKNDPIVQLDTSNVVIQLDQAKAARRVAIAARDNARAELARTQLLFDAGSAPPAVMDKVRAGYEQSDAGVAQADAQVRFLEETLRDHTLRAPFDGVVTARTKGVGDYLAMTPPTPVAILTSLDLVEVRLSVPEGLVDRLAPGQVLKGRALPGGAAFQAKVTSVGAIVDPATRAVEVLATVQSGSGRVRPGGLAEVDLGTSAAGEGPLVPAQAIGREGDRRFVWLVSGDGAVSRRTVEVEPVTPQWARVTGVAPDERVVVEGGAALTDGQRVAVAE
jgi:RND family efflux transporter MFP subunit